MGRNTAISWCHHTFNAWLGCTKVSAGCKLCYAEALDKRGLHGGGGHWGPNAKRFVFGDDYWREPLAWNRHALDADARRQVFCSSLSDVFEKRDDLIPHRRRLWALIKECHQLDWLLLTKRPENAPDMLPWMDRGVQVSYPWPNVWLGVTAEDNEQVELRIPQLRAIPAARRFVSCEPILEHIGETTWDLALGFRSGLEPIDWLIVGNESGHGARPAQVAWVRDARDAAQRHNVAFHFKQWAGKDVPDGISRDPSHFEVEQKKGKIHLPLLDGQQWAEFPR